MLSRPRYNCYPVVIYQYEVCRSLPAASLNPNLSEFNLNIYLALLHVVL